MNNDEEKKLYGFSGQQNCVFDYLDFGSEQCTVFYVCILSSYEIIRSLFLQLQQQHHRY